jgi:hypothetical protein
MAGKRLQESRKRHGKGKKKAASPTFFFDGLGGARGGKNSRGWGKREAIADFGLASGDISYARCKAPGSDLVMTNPRLC